MFNTYNTRKKFILKNIGLTGRSGNQLYNQCSSFCESVEYSSGAYSDFVNKNGPYLLVAWNRVLISLYADIFRLMNALDLCMILFV